MVCTFFRSENSEENIQFQISGNDDNVGTSEENHRLYGKRKQ